MAEEAPHEGCTRHGRLQDLPQNSIHQFIVGRDPRPVSMSADDVRATLFDPFAQRLLAEGIFPQTAGALVDEFRRAHGPDDPRADERSFLLGEGSQVPVGELPFDARFLRFVIALGTVDAALVLVSASSPASDSVEVMAWDERVGGFNYYRTTPDGGWVFAGNSADALREDSDGKGPFQSHTTGNFLMKELRFPWVHWHSPVRGAASVDPAIFEGSDLAGHRWVRPLGDGDGTLAGADVCELEVAIPSVERWTAVRFEAIRTGQEPPRPERTLRQVLTSPTVNLVSSNTRSDEARAGTQIDLPRQFFVDSETLSDEELLGLEPAPRLLVPAEAYLAVMQELDVRLEIPEIEFRQPGDTHFAFVVPERAFEDIEVVKAATGVLLTKRLAACLLMVDFPNPVFSARRFALLQRAKTVSADLAAGPEAFSEAVADAIRAYAAQGSPEAEFARLWERGDDWPAACNELLGAYYRALTERLDAEPEAAFRDWFRLAESVRRHAADVKKMPIFEFPLLLAVSEAKEEDLVMRADGTVGAPA